MLAAMGLFLQEQLPWVASVEHAIGRVPGLSSFLAKLTLLGNEEFFLVLLPFVYWCISRRIGRRLGVLLIGGDALNAILKVACALPRPYWVSSQVFTGAKDGSFGFPSSHAMNAASIWSFLALHTRRRVLWLALAFLLACGIAVSRVSLGLHFPMDVTGGLLLGYLVLFIFARGIPKWEARAREWPLSTQIWVATLGAGLILGFFFLARHIGQTGPFGKYPSFDPTEDPLSSEAIFKRAGAMWGLLVGLCVASRVARFEVPPTLPRKAACFLVGLVVMAAIYMGLKLVFPSGEGKLPLVLGGVRYALVSLWVVWGAPWLFIKLKLAPRKIPAEVV